MEYRYKKARVVCRILLIYFKMLENYHLLTNFMDMACNGKMVVEPKSGTNIPLCLPSSSPSHPKSQSTTFATFS